MIDLLSNLPAPTPEALRAARALAGHSQAEAAQTCGYGAAIRWSELERGVRQIDAARWALYLLATGQHPALELKPRA